MNIPKPPKLIGPPIYRPSPSVQPALSAPPVYRPNAAVQTKAAHAPRLIGPPVYKPGPTVATRAVLQRMQTPHVPALTMNQANPVRTYTDCTTNLAVTINGESGPSFKNGNKQCYIGNLVSAFPDHQRSGKEPHAEENFAGWLLSQKLPLLRDQSGQSKRLSFSMDRSPCEPCARLLVRLKNAYGLEMRLKATQTTTNSQVKGLQILSDAGVLFRYSTKDQLKKKYPAIKENWKTYKAADERDTINERTQKRYVTAYHKYKGNTNPNAKRASKEPFGWQHESKQATGIFGYDVTTPWSQRTPSRSWKQGPTGATTTTTTTTTAATTSLTGQKRTLHQLSEVEERPQKKAKRVSQQRGSQKRAVHQRKNTTNEEDDSEES